MDVQTERWLGPMITELLSRPAGNAAFARFMERAVGIGDNGAAGVDWIRLGQMMRNELGWDDYPATP